MKARIAPLALFTALIFLGSCQKDPINDDPTTEPNQLDLALEDALRSASNGIGKAFYRFPSSLDEIPQDPNNPLTAEKVALGKLLYHETGLATNPKLEEGRYTYSCASCHHVDGGFQACLPQGISEGGLGFGLHGEGRLPNPNYTTDLLDIQPIRSPSALNIAYQPNILWNGQFGATDKNVGTDASWGENTPIWWNHLGYEGTETQAIAGLIVHRLGMPEWLFEETAYRDMFYAAFGNVGDDTLMSNVYGGLAIAAYERTLLATEAPFQRWLEGETTAMSTKEKRGALLFFTKGECFNCHNGPSLANMDFYALGMKDLDGAGVYLPSHEDPTVHLGRGGFTHDPADEYKFKVPQLYNLINSRFYGHGASFNSVEAVVRYKNNASPENASVPISQLSEYFHPLNLSNSEIDDLTAFIEHGLYDNNLERYVPSTIPSGYCFPNNDQRSAHDLGCQ